jgi:hypothetical protein
VTKNASLIPTVKDAVSMKHGQMAAITGGNSSSLIETVVSKKSKPTGFKREGIFMDNFFVRTFIKNPVGLIVLGFVCIAGTYGSVGIVGPIVGIIITVTGIVWLVRRSQRPPA